MNFTRKYIGCQYTIFTRFSIDDRDNKVLRLIIQLYFGSCNRNEYDR